MKHNGSEAFLRLLALLEAIVKLSCTSSNQVILRKYFDFLIEIMTGVSLASAVGLKTHIYFGIFNLYKLLFLSSSHQWALFFVRKNKHDKRIKPVANI